MLGEFIKSYIAQDLKEEGFLRKGTTWNRKTGNVLDVLNLQKGRPRPDRGIDFTLNVGLWMEEVWSACWARTTPSFIREEDCFPRFRIGFLLENFNPRFRDKWWFLDSEEALSSVGEEVRGILRSKCLPLFGRFSKVEEVLSFAETTVPVKLPLEKLYLGVLRHLRGDRELSESAFNELNTDPNWGRRAEEVLLRLRQGS